MKLKAQPISSELAGGEGHRDGPDPCVFSRVEPAPSAICDWSANDDLKPYG
ncbi:MAG: hypothetical protein V7641_2968 [Blastocatellia bacterium]